uniref:Uncharacterized protein n=1 Tax=Musa acuminata subsp. malaccensis TaxID=214687 RepID=A0A804IZX6_MUSAM
MLSSCILLQLIPHHKKLIVFFSDRNQN